jgi:Meiotically up-regulated gene 113
LNPTTLEEIQSLLNADDLQVGQTFRLMQTGVIKSSDIVAAGSGGNTGVVYINKQILKAILDEVIPKSSYIALYSARTISRLLGLQTETSQETRKYLEDLRQKLLIRASEEEALVHDKVVLENQSTKLSDLAKEIDQAIYVYTFPTYYRAGLETDPELKWLKIGTTNKGVWKRVIEQSRQTSMPEDPILLRIYHQDGVDIESCEKKFHSVLLSVRHAQSSASNTKAGKEWFATTEEALDAIADLMNLKIERDISFD